jgi:transcriptional regulator with XRE-family HTH domain
MELIKEVKKIRHDLGISQRELGERLGRNPDHIKHIERGSKKQSANDYLKIKELEQNFKGTAVPDNRTSIKGA